MAATPTILMPQRPEPAVPLEFRGLWRRRVLKTADLVDSETTVYWLQAGSIYADIRVPANRPRCDSLDDASTGTLRGLAQQQGFAGNLQAEGNLLTWHRWLDYQPPTPVADVGRVHFENEVLIENGALASYMEEWIRVAAPHPDSIALSLRWERRAGRLTYKRRGVLIAMGSYFMIAIGRTEPLPDRPNLEAIVEDESLEEAVRRRTLDCVIDFGERQGRLWTITLSTLPFREGASFSTHHGSWSDSAPNFANQRVDDTTTRGWQKLEFSDAFSGFP